VVNNCVRDLASGMPTHLLLNSVNFVQVCCNNAVGCEAATPNRDLEVNLTAQSDYNEAMRLIGAHLVQLLADYSITQGLVVKKVLEFCFSKWTAREDSVALASAIVNQMFPPFPTAVQKVEPTTPYQKLAESIWSGLKQNSPVRSASTIPSIAFLASQLARPVPDRPITTIDLFANALKHLNQMESHKSLPRPFQTQLARAFVVALNFIKQTLRSQANSLPKQPTETSFEDPTEIGNATDSPTGTKQLTFPDDNDTKPTLSCLELATEIAIGLIKAKDKDDKNASVRRNQHFALNQFNRILTWSAAIYHQGDKTSLCDHINPTVQVDSDQSGQIGRNLGQRQCDRYTVLMCRTVYV